MTIIEVRVPSPGESIREVQLANWLVADGDYVEKDAEIAEIDSDKATLPIAAPESGRISFKADLGDTLAIGAVLCTIDTAAQAPEGKKETGKGLPSNAEKEGKTKSLPSGDKDAAVREGVQSTSHELHMSPLARKLMAESGLTDTEFTDRLRSIRFTRHDVEEVIRFEKKPASPLPVHEHNKPFSRDIDRKKMSTLRLKLSERLVAVKNQTAMLTTFNEVNMGAVLALKQKYSDAFKEKHGFGIGLTSFFAKAVTIALQEFPQVNAQIDGDDLLIPSYVDLGIAVSAPKGLVVPVIRNAESLSLPEIEGRVKELAAKARANKITLEDMTGGTYTISNGGVFGSMMSTPILNPPQSAILGLHNIVERPVAVNGKIEIHPMMYLAMSYDHRVIDGRESVSFLVRVKEMIENPLSMILGGRDATKALLGIG